MLPPPHFTLYACRNCGWVDFHPATSCPRCNNEVEQTDVPGEGKIVTYTTIRYPPKGFESQAPYVVAIIKINSGPQVIGRILNSADEVAVGSSVTLTSQKDGVLEFRLS
jgi:hypothetical protein